MFVSPEDAMKPWEILEQIWENDMAGKFELAGEAVKKHRRGAPLTDDEIEAAIVVLTYLNKAVPPLGKEYTLFAKDIGQQLGMMEGYRDARAEEKRLAAKKGG